MSCRIRMTIMIFANVLMLVFLAGCSGTSDQTIRAYNALGRGKHLDLEEDGYIIGIEKYKREDIGAPVEGDPARFRSLPNPTASKLISQQNHEFTKATDDLKAMLVTHIASYFSERHYLFNAYNCSLKGTLNYKKGYDALEVLEKDLLERLMQAEDQAKPYSHIFIMSMGWNNDQYVSIYRYNRILENLSDIAEKQGDADFKPLVIGITWPSAWFTIEDSWFKKKVIGHFGSYTNKSNDADEIGYTIMNWFINHQLPRVRKAMAPNSFPKVIAIGHSMGARLLSRAIFSGQHLKTASPENGGIVDMFIGLQGAFSARRFVSDDSGEGAPYRDYASLPTIIILTSSENDIANPFAFWSKHVGGGNGLKYMKENENVFNVLVWSSEREKLEAAIREYSRNREVIALDSKEIVKGPDAHNDILDSDVAELIQFCIGSID
jgi:hypothetical protein